MGEGEAKYGHARRIILSMPEGVDEEKFQKSCRMWAKDMLPGYDYLIAFHLKSNDKKLISLIVIFFFCVPLVKTGRGFI